MGHCMGRLKGRDYPFFHRKELEGPQCLIIRGICIINPPLVPQICVLRPYTGIIQPCGDGMCIKHLAVFILQEITLGALKDTERASCKPCCMSPALYPLSPCLN